MKKLLLSLLTFVLTVSISFADVVEKNYTFSEPQVSEADGFQIINFEEAMLNGISGEPMLPYFSVSLLLPPGHAAREIEIIPGEEVILEGNYQLYPMQHSQPISKGGSGIFAFKEDVYQKDASYPESAAGELTTQFLNGYAVAMTAFTPVKYNPVTGQVSYYKSLTVKINSVVDQIATKALENLHSGAEVLKRVTSLAQNTEAINSYPVKETRGDDYQMIIVTPAQFADDFQQLVDFYAPRGIIAQIATTEDIYSSMTGQDNPEKIRNYIIQEYQDHGIQHVTLGGDVEHVPYRGFYCHVQSSSVYEDDNIPADLYFCALDGTWNDNGNNLWGEIGEDDLLPEIGMGRMSVSTQAELDALLNKTIMYQQNPVLGELDNPFLVGEFLYDPPETWGSDYLELLIGYHEDNGYTTNGIPEDQNIEKMYESEGSWSATTLKNTMNQGGGFIHHVGHANSNYTMKFYNSDITNSNFAPLDGVTHNYTLIYSHGCICGAFDDNDCIAEKMIGIDNLAVAVYMNSRYGWFNEGQTEGPAAHLNRELVDAYYDKKESRLGMAYTMARIETAPWVTAPGQHEEGALRWNFYDCNLLGDAAVRFWADEPIDVVADYQEALPIGAPSISVTLTENGNPAEAIDCIFMMEDMVYGMATTDESGVAEIVFTEAIANVGDASIFISGYNCQLEELPVSVIPNGGAFVVYSSSVVNDDDGNGNGIADYNESILLTTEMKNVGTAQADNVMVTLSSSDAFVTITDDSEDFGNIAGGATLSMEDAFAFDISADVPDQHSILFNVQAQGQDTWSSTFSIMVCAPALAMNDFFINDAVSGNNNGLLEPGETADIIITAANNGGADAYEVMATLIGEQYITINTAGAQDMGDLSAGITQDVTFSVSASENTPAGYTASIQISFEAMYGIEQSDVINLLFPDYCDATTSTEDEYISRVQFGDIDNTSTWQGGVANYTDQNTVLEPGATEEITITNGNAWASDMVTVWVDWNVDMEFGSSANETFELENVGGAGEIFTGTISVPDGQMAANYRMRIRMTYSSAPEPCGDASYGEIEEYTVSIAGGVLAVNVSCTPDEICVGESSQMMAQPNGGSGTYTYVWSPETGLNDPTIQNPEAMPEETTTYTVEVSDGANTTSSQATITVHDLPETPFISLDDITLTSDASEGNQWYDSQGPIEGATGQSYTCAWEDVYHCVVFNEFSCESFPSNSIHVVVTGIGELSLSNPISVYPNPFADKVFIEAYLENGVSYKLSIYNTLGAEVKVISEGTASAEGMNIFTFPSHGLEEGIYFFKLITDNHVSVKKIIHTK